MVKETIELVLWKVDVILEIFHKDFLFTVQFLQNVKELTFSESLTQDPN